MRSRAWPSRPVPSQCLVLDTRIPHFPSQLGAALQQWTWMGITDASIEPLGTVGPAETSVPLLEVAQSLGAAILKPKFLSLPLQSPSFPLVQLGVGPCPNCWDPNPPLGSEFQSSEVLRARGSQGLPTCDNETLLQTSDLWSLLLSTGSALAMAAIWGRQAWECTGQNCKSWGREQRRWLGCCEHPAL